MTMKTVQSVFREQTVGVQTSIHDCHNTAEAETIISSGTSIDFFCDKVTYEGKNDTHNTWDSLNDLVDMSNVVQYANVIIKIAGEMKAGTANAKLKVELYIPENIGNVTPEYLVDEKTFVIPDVGAYHPDFIIFHAYNGPASQVDNFKMRLTANDGDITIKNTKIRTGV